MDHTVDHTVEYTVEYTVEHIPVIVGPTAVGKTGVALALARHLDAEIVSADSRQLFRELNIGTAKPTADELATIRHHFVDDLALGTAFSAGQFADMAHERIAQIRDRGKRVVVVGGSTLYIHALVYGLADIPQIDDAIVAKTNQQLQEHGSDWLHAELSAVDPEGAARIDPSKSHRIVRALSVHRATGRPLASYWRPSCGNSLFRVFVLDRDRQELYSRINRRVDDMVSRGLLEEVRGLLDSGIDESLQSLQSIGYAELISHLRGERSLAEAVSLMKRNSRRYAKRQLTWFRRYTEAVWLDATAPVTTTCRSILAAC